MAPVFTGRAFGFGRVAAVVAAGSDGSISQATGGLPILNTTGTYGETLASGVRDDPFASNLVWAVPLGTSSGLNFTDQSPTGRSSSTYNITNGSPAIASNTASGNFQFYGGSAKFSGGAQGSYSTNVWSALGTGQWTIEMWVKADTGQTMTPGYGCTIISCGSASNNSAGLYNVGFGGNGDSSPNLGMGLIGGASHYITDAGDGAIGPAPLGVWMHIAQTKDGSNEVRTYRDGTKVAQSTASQGITNVNQGLIGGQYYGAYASYIDFYLQDVRMYNTAKYTADSFFVVTPKS
jgi:hypothetical protein